MAKTKTTKNNPTRGQRAEKSKAKTKKKNDMRVAVAGGGVKIKRNSTA